MTMYDCVKKAIIEARDQEIKTIYERTEDEKWGLSIKEAQISESYVKSVSEKIMRLLFEDVETYGTHLK